MMGLPNRLRAGIYESRRSETTLLLKAGGDPFGTLSTPIALLTKCASAAYWYLEGMFRGLGDVQPFKAR